MASVSPLSDDEANGAVRETFRAIEGRQGLVPNMYRTLGHAPAVLQAVLSMGQAIRGDLDPKLRELAYLKTAQIHDCLY